MANKAKRMKAKTDYREPVSTAERIYAIRRVKERQIVQENMVI